MIRLHVTVEGRTEEAFVNRTLRPYLANFGVYADVRCVMTGRKGGMGFRGGMSSYAKAKNDIVRWLKEDRNANVFFTTMFDYYALPNDFPGYAEAEKLQDPYDKVTAIESSFDEDVADRRFVPYIQLHEFEALLFSSLEGFEALFDENEMDYKGIRNVLDAFPNPEDINDSPLTAPSKRIQSLIPGYNKVAYGVMLAEYIGMDTLLEKCRHFRSWIEQLKSVLT